MLLRLGAVSGENDRAVAAALIKALASRAAPIDRAFFDWRGGRDPGPEHTSRGVSGPRRPPRRSRTAAVASILVGGRALFDAYRRGRGDLVRDCRSRRLAAIRRSLQPFDEWARRWNTMHRQLDEANSAGRRARCRGADPGHRQIQQRAMLIWSGPTGDASAEVAAARTAWPSWAAHSHAYRIEAVRRFANVVRAKESEFADLIARETGKPLWEARPWSARHRQVQISVEGLCRANADAKGWKEPRIGDRIAVRHKPHGVLAVLGPYNFPAHLPQWAHCAGADCRQRRRLQAVGETRRRPASFWFAASTRRRFRKASSGSSSAGPKRTPSGATRHRRAPFHGLGAGRRFAAQQFAETPQKILALELGGNNPLVVWGAQDIDAAALITVQSAYLTAGQRCTAARRLIVEDGKKAPCSQRSESSWAGSSSSSRCANRSPSWARSSTMRADHVQEQWLDLVTLKGGKPLRHLDRPSADRPSLTPAVIDVTEVRGRSDEEIFGPVLQVIRVKDFDAAIDEANNTRFGLAASLIGGSPEMYDKFWANVRAGVINWNKPTNGAPSNAPFGGVGISETTGRAPSMPPTIALTRLPASKPTAPARRSAKACATRICRRISGRGLLRGLARNSHASLFRRAAFKRL